MPCSDDVAPPSVTLSSHRDSRRRSLVPIPSATIGLPTPAGRDDDVARPEAGSGRAGAQHRTGRRLGGGREEDVPRHGSAIPGAEVDLGPAPARGRSIASWSIRRKLTLLVMIPLIALLVGGGALVTQIALEYRQANTARVYADAIAPGAAELRRPSEGVLRRHPHRRGRAEEAPRRHRPAGHRAPRRPRGRPEPGRAHRRPDDQGRVARASRCRASATPADASTASTPTAGRRRCRATPASSR